MPKETAGAAAVLGFKPSTLFTGAVESLVTDRSRPTSRPPCAALAKATHRRPGVSRLDITVDATAKNAGRPRRRTTDG